MTHYLDMAAHLGAVRHERKSNERDWKPALSCSFSGASLAEQ
jgi:hypothetical protein